MIKFLRKMAVTTSLKNTETSGTIEQNVNS